MRAEHDLKIIATLAAIRAMRGIVSQTPDGKSGEEVVVEAALKPHRTTEISVSPAAPKTVLNP